MPKSRSRRKPPSRPTSQRPSRPREPLVKHPAPGMRGQVERATAPALVWLSARPRFFLPVLTAVLLVAGLAAPAVVGGVLLLVLAALVGWLSYLSWPAVQGVQRLLRVGTIGLVLAAALGKLTG